MASVFGPAEVFFLNGRKGRLFTMYYPATVEENRHQAVIIVPPFAEEMNKSRRTLALIARGLASRGIGAMLIDLYGTGDSEGDFSECTWEVWKTDIESGIHWLGERGIRKLNILGLRMGAMLATDFLQQRDLDLNKIVFWNPVTLGKTMMTQFLRLRVAAAMGKEDKEKETTSTLRRMLQEGKTVEVGGYELNPDLVRSIDSLSLAKMSLPEKSQALWIDVVPNQGDSILPASKKVVENWSGRGVEINARALSGPQFWSTPEITVLPDIVGLTSKYF